MAQQKKKTVGLSKPVSFRLSESDHAAYLKKCADAGLKPSQFFRECVLGNKTQVVARLTGSPDLKTLLFLFNKTSNNINQLAHRAHKDHLAGQLDNKAYREILYSLDSIASYMKVTMKNAN